MLQDEMHGNKRALPYEHNYIPTFRQDIAKCYLLTKLMCCAINPLENANYPHYLSFQSDELEKLKKKSKKNANNLLMHFLLIFF